MQYEEALSKLYTLSGELAPAAPGAPRRKFELAHMRVLAEALGNPQNRYPSVLIAGTNGKGSTAATLASILSVSGYRTGLYTSPHLQRPNERIQISGATPGENSLSEISDDAFAKAFGKVEAIATQLVSEGRLPHPPSFFEVMTAMAFIAFADARIEIAVLEVGLGGRLDATNIVEPLLSVITDISLDHTEWLGNTLTEIAREKAGILRPHGRLVTLPQHPEANAAIGEVAVKLDVTGVNAAAYLPDRISGDISYPLVIQGEGITVASPLPGDHQRRNVALAIAVSEQLLINQSFSLIWARSIESGIRLTRWPGRLESTTIPGTEIAMLMDVAHNPAGAWTLRSHLSRQMDAGHLPSPRTLVFSALKDKSIREMAQILFPLFDGPEDRILLAPIRSPRAASAEMLAEVAAALDTAAEVCASVADAMTKAADRDGSVIVSGSVYLVAEAKTWLKEQHG
jgi:dihydrofolate synthase/folylpolyglutamate synthase